MGNCPPSLESMGLKKFYQGKKIFLTGHTGFKGSWFQEYLLFLGAEVVGFSLPENINDLKLLKPVIKRVKPDLVFHLAAQALVLDSYLDPLNTLQTNILGTANLLEACRAVPSVKAIVVITSDKCYLNQEWAWPYRESDHLGGHDPYSASKAGAEIVARAYYLSFLQMAQVGIATARAGNVIGGNDFAAHRLIPDIVRSLANRETITLRHPQSIRPWQHVLDCIYGYLLLGQKLYLKPAKFSGSFNFGPHETWTVEKLSREFLQYFPKTKIKVLASNPHEAKLLKLDPSKAYELLSWQNELTTKEAILWTAAWYQKYLLHKDLKQITQQQIARYDQKKNINFS